MSQMQTIDYVMKILDEKLQNNDFHLVKKITSHITCEDCRNVVLHNHKHNKKCKDCFIIHNQHECKKCGETKLILVEGSFSGYRCKKCVSEYMKKQNYDEDLYSDTDETPSDYFDYDSDDSDSDDELTSISDFDSDFEGYDSD